MHLPVFRAKTIHQNVVRLLTREVVLLNFSLQKCCFDVSNVRRGVVRVQFILPKLKLCMCKRQMNLSTSQEYLVLYVTCA